MPATYAHYKLGQAILAEASLPIREVITAYPNLFQIGLHGPDILFYHDPLSSNEVRKLGYDMHKRSGLEWFSHAKKVLKLHPDRPDYLAYTYGVICHFALDVTCHGYINEKAASSGIHHYEIESEFDRELMIRDRLDPIRQYVTNHIVASTANAEIIKDFYPGVSTKSMQKALSGMIFYLNILITPSRLKRNILFFALRLAGQTNLQGLFINYEPNTMCMDSTQHLLTLFEKGKTLALELLDTFLEYIEHEVPPASIYHYSFDSQPVD